MRVVLVAYFDRITGWGGWEENFDHETHEIHEREFYPQITQIKTGAGQVFTAKGREWENLSRIS